MKLHQQFDLNLEKSSALKVDNLNDIPKAINEIPILVETLIKHLLEKGYVVIREGAYFTGLPRSITVIKEFTGPFVTKFSSKIKEDFDNISKGLGIDKLFE